MWLAENSTMLIVCCCILYTVSVALIAYFMCNTVALRTHGTHTGGISRNHQQTVQDDNSVLNSSIVMTADQFSQVNKRLNIDHLPKFWTKEPVLWFKSAESFFKAHNICDDQDRFNYVIRALEPPQLKLAEPLLSGHDSDPNLYKSIKECLTKHYSISKEKQLNNLYHENLGDSTPVDFLRRLRACLISFDLKEPTTEHLLRKVFLEGLPGDVSRLLVAVGEADLDTLAQKAEDVLSINDNKSNEAPNIGLKQNKVNAHFEKQLASLASNVECISKRLFPSSGYDLARSRKISVPHDSNDDSGLCFYHHRYGDQARQCRKPCSWENSPNFWPYSSKRKNDRLND